MGREWDQKLRRRIGDSVFRACDAVSGGFLITDTTKGGHSLGEPEKATGFAVVEVLSEDRSQVIGEFQIKVARVPRTPRYREPFGVALTERKWTNEERNPSHSLGPSKVRNP